jgi:hypothetical protein
MKKQATKENRKFKIIENFLILALFILAIIFLSVSGKLTGYAMLSGSAKTKISNLKFFLAGSILLFVAIILFFIKSRNFKF